MRTAIAAGCTLALLLPDPSAHAFCGFYVSGSDKKMFNDATSVVLMRAGTRTVLSMQNDYRGPLEDFAMVIPVPVVLRAADVKVVPKAVFDRIDTLSSPRLVEYWEQDPCPEEMTGLYGTIGHGAGTGVGYGTGGGYAVGSGRGGMRGRDVSVPARAAVAPILASFSVAPATVTAGLPTDVTWSFEFSNQPYPAPSCTVDHGVGAVTAGRPSKITLDASSDVTLTCANSAGAATKKARINVVKVEARFDVEEYQIVILSASEAVGLQDWLKLNRYKIPEGAEPLLRPYVAAGSKFFVARVDPRKVKMVEGRVALSPLRFHYDSEEFSLPIRLGMANSSGKQDLIVNILSPDRRFEVANYKNVTIPTNIDVTAAVKGRFAEFYAALFDKTLEANPGAVVTEYAWTAQPGRGAKCDPCPPVLPEDADMMTLGGDVVGGPIQRGGFVLTRLHARYSAADMADDLRFREATPIAGGREHLVAGRGLEIGASPSPQNFFQARYAVRHAWTSPIKCAAPQRGLWGGPPNGVAKQTLAATKTAFAPRGSFQLAAAIGRDVTEIGLLRATPTAKPTPPPVTPKKSFWFVIGALAGVLLLGGSALRRRD